MGRLRRRQIRTPPIRELRQVQTRARSRAVGRTAEEMQPSRRQLRRRTRVFAAASAGNSPGTSIAYCEPAEIRNERSEDGDEATSADFDLPKRRLQRFSPGLAAEIEEFFLAAEARERRRFADKYNYDVASDAPLAGRYEWLLPAP